MTVEILNKRTENPDEPSDVTRALRRWADGDEQARDELIRLTHERLAQVASKLCARRWNPGEVRTQTLMQEMFVKLEKADCAIQDREHFVRLAIQMMCRVLTDLGKYHMRAKRMPPGGFVALDALGEPSQDPIVDPVSLIDLRDALERIAAYDDELRAVIVLHAMYELTLVETAELMGCSRATVARRYELARLSLVRELAEEEA